MEVEENRSSKRSRVGNGTQATKLGDHDQHQDDDEEDGDGKGRLRPWHNPSSRIYRVSRASGGKDRHSKVYTAKGLRDRRVRLSVSTAIQFYDLQDRLGYDQPSKAIEWLIKAAASAIAELPSLNTSSFPEPPTSHLDNNQEKPLSDPGLQDPEAEPSYNQQQHSSTSETSKGSVLSLSRSEIRTKARERAKERALKDKKERDDGNVVSTTAATAAHYQNVSSGLNSQSSFTDLLTGGSSSTNAQPSSSANFIQKQIRTMPPVTATADYFGTQSGLFGQQLQQKLTHQIHPGFSTQVHFGTNSPMGMVPFSNAGDHPAEMQQFAFLQDHFFPVAAAAAAASGDYNLNFSISSSGLAGFHRGTLQSNSSPSHQLPHHHHHHPQLQVQRLSSPLDGSNAPVPFFFGTAATTAAAGPTEGQYSAGFDGHLQLCDGYKNMELKGKGKS